ncbi:MAG: hypothetical protein JJ958_06660 [Balneola sp.]|nr:hypothetical protein [Balneola sp.]
MADQNELEKQAEQVKKVSKTGLLPCPFCGSIELSGITIPVPRADEKEKKFHFIQCEHCFCTGPNRFEMKEARHLWQTRAEEA